MADLVELTDGQTTVFITHRLAGLDAMDEILVLDAGRVIERGTHAQPGRRGGPYAAAMGAGTWLSTSESGSPAMTNVDLARVQFASTTIYHFLFVPVTIGLAFLVAILQTLWHRSGESRQRRLTRFFGTLLLINVAIGVVTGLVQEFEFGMNWSAYSRFVGDVFGAPLAMEGLAAFFLESTFLGLVGLRLGPAAQTRASGLHLAGGGGQRAFRGVHHGRQLLDAAPGRLHHQLQDRRAGAQQHRGGVHEPGVPVGLHPRPAGLGRNRVAGMLAVSPGICAGAARSTPSRNTARCPWSCCFPHHPGHVRRQRARGRSKPSTNR